MLLRLDLHRAYDLYLWSLSKVSAGLFEVVLSTILKDDAAYSRWEGHRVQLIADSDLIAKHYETFTELNGPRYKF